MRTLKFNYIQKVHRGNKFKLWSCSKNKKGCKARFSGSLDDQWYWKYNPRHTCVNPSEDDLTPDEAAAQLLESVFSALPKPKLKTKAITKAAKQVAAYNY